MDISLNNFNDRDLGDIAVLYCDQIPLSLLARLGAFFFRRLIGDAVCRGLIDIYICRENEVMVGFLIATGDPAWMAKTMRARPLIYLCMLGLRILKPRVMQYAITSLPHLSIINRDGEKNGDLQQELVELFAIAVSPRFRKMNVATLLIRRFEQTCNSKQVHSYIIRTLEDNVASNILYQKIGAVKHYSRIGANGLVNTYIRNL